MGFQPTAGIDSYNSTPSNNNVKPENHTVRTTSKPGTANRRTLKENRMKLSRGVSGLREESRGLEARYRRSSKAKSKDAVMDIIAKNSEPATISSNNGWSDLNSEVGLDTPTKSDTPQKAVNEADGKLSRTEKIKKGIYVPERLPQDYHGTEAGSAIEAATGIVGRVQETVHGREISGDSAWERGLRHKELSDSEIKPKESEALKQWAKENNKLLDQSYIDDLKPFEGKGGAEHNVYLSKDGSRVVKVNRLSFHDNYLEYLHRLAVHNAEFPDTAYTLEGFIDQEGKLLPVVSQLWVRGRKATFQESHDNLVKLGYEPIDRPPPYQLPCPWHRS